jgi:hypothetical protein
MSVQEIIQHAIDKNPLALKEALEEELRGRVALALEAKMSEQEEEDEEDEDEEEDEGMKESFDLSDLTLEELEDFMMSEGIFGKIGKAVSSIPGAVRISKHVKSGDIDSLHREITQIASKSANPGSEDHARIVKGLYNTITSGKMKNVHPKTMEKAKKMTESFDLSDLTLEELEDFMMSGDFDQLDELDKRTLASYVKKANADAMNQAQKSGDYRHPDYSPKYFTKAMKRMRGVEKAVDRLAK